jgi:hypothetical protein
VLVHEPAEHDRIAAIDRAQELARRLFSPGSGGLLASDTRRPTGQQRQPEQELPGHTHGSLLLGSSTVDGIDKETACGVMFEHSCRRFVAAVPGA